MPKSHDSAPVLNTIHLVLWQCWIVVEWVSEDYLYTELPFGTSVIPGWAANEILGVVIFEVVQLSIL